MVKVRIGIGVVGIVDIIVGIVCSIVGIVRIMVKVRIRIVVLFDRCKLLFVGGLVIIIGFKKKKKKKFNWFWECFGHFVDILGDFL